MVSPPSGGEVTASCLGQSVDRSLCDVPQRETGSLRVPSLSSGRSGDRPCPRVVACRDDSGRSSLAREGVVRRPPASTDPTTSRPALVGQSASAAPL